MSRNGSKCANQTLLDSHSDGISDCEIVWKSPEDFDQKLTTEMRDERHVAVFTHLFRLIWMKMLLHKANMLRWLYPVVLDHLSNFQSF